MSWWHWVLIGIGVYLALGIVMTFVLLQTPYAENPLWLMILLWPLFLFIM